MKMSQTHAHPDGWTIDVKTVYPLKTSFWQALAISRIIHGSLYQRLVFPKGTNNQNSVKMFLIILYFKYSIHTDLKG